MNGLYLHLSHQEVSDTCVLLPRRSDKMADMKFVLLHEGKNDDGIRQFFADVWELYVKVSGGE